MTTALIRKVFYFDITFAKAKLNVTRINLTVQFLFKDLIFLNGGKQYSVLKNSSREAGRLKRHSFSLNRRLAVNRNG